MQVLPYSLSDLAVEALGQLVSVLVKNIVSAQAPDHAVAHLEEMIAMQVPPNMADHVTEKLLISILGSFDELVLASSMSQNGYGMYMQRCESAGKAALCAARATIHPSTTCFQYNCDYEGLPSSSYIRKFIKAYLKHLLLKLKNLRVLKLRAVEFDGHLLENCEVSFQNLQEFAYNFCSDDILQALASMCSKLKVLDIRESSGVTNISVEYILKFRELRSLKITNTSITSQGVTGIMKGLPQESWNFPTDVSMKLDLSEFKSTFTANQISLVPESFKNLVSLELFLTVECNLTPLASLSRLRNLALCRYGFPNIPDFHFTYAEDLLRHIGHRLEKLKIVDLKGTDLCYIAVTCPILHTLVLQFSDSRRLGFREGMSVRKYAERFPVPELPSVKCLDMKLRNCEVTEYLLSRMQCVQQLRLWWIYNSPESLLDYLVLAMSCERIQELEVRETRIRVSGQHAILTTVNGRNVITNVCNLRDLIWKVFKVSHMKCSKNYRTYR